MRLGLIAVQTTALVALIALSIAGAGCGSSGPTASALSSTSTPVFSVSYAMIPALQITWTTDYSLVTNFEIQSCTGSNQSCTPIYFVNALGDAPVATDQNHAANIAFQISVNPDLNGSQKRYGFNTQSATNPGTLRIRAYNDTDQSGWTYSH